MPNFIMQNTIYIPELFALKQFHSAIFIMYEVFLSQQYLQRLNSTKFLAKLHEYVIFHSKRRFVTLHT